MSYLLPQKNCMVQLKTLSKWKPTRKAGQIPNLKLNPYKENYYSLSAPQASDFIKVH